MFDMNYERGHEGFVLNQKHAFGWYDLVYSIDLRYRCTYIHSASLLIHKILRHEICCE